MLNSIVRSWFPLLVRGGGDHASVVLTGRAGHDTKASAGATLKRMDTGAQFAESAVEKHALTIDGPDEVRAGSVFSVRVAVVGADAFPSGAKHHFRWLALHFIPEDSDCGINLGHYMFSPPEDPPGVVRYCAVCTVPAISVSAVIWRTGTLRALALCSIHGMCECTKRVRVV
jgi:desulfoferrodoxin (superoxide reductase-like protein)